MNRDLEECVWRALAGRPELECKLAPETAVSDEDIAVTFAGMSDLMGAALAHHVLDMVCGGRDSPSIGPSEKSAYLYNKINRARQLEVVSSLNDWGFDTVVMKGLASAHQFFPDPNLRTTGDIDVLVRDETELRACIAKLADTGFEFDRGFTLPPWGFPTDVSFLPMVSPDGIVHIDFHLKPDSYPLPLGLTAGDTFEAAKILNVDGIALKVPKLEHHYLISLSNAARERFGPTTCRSIIDAGRLVTQCKDIDWLEIEDRAGKAGMSKAHRTFCHILFALGADFGSQMEQSFTSNPNAEGLTHRLLKFTPEAHDSAQKFLIELRDCYDLPQWLAIWIGRIKGMVAPRTGVPEL